MPFFVGKSGAFKRVVGNWVARDGSWKRVTKRWIGVGGVWRVKYKSGSVAVMPAVLSSFAYSPTQAYSTIFFHPDGRVVGVVLNQAEPFTSQLGNWFDPVTAGAGNAFEIKFTRIAGNVDPTGATLNTWMPLTTMRQLTVAVAAAVNNTMTATVEVSIRPAGGAPETEVKDAVTLSAVTYSQTNTTPPPSRGGRIDQVGWDHRMEQ